MPSARAEVRLARTADGLTTTRIVLAVAIAVLAAERAIDATAITLSVAWVTDFLDGRLARRTSEPTRLGEHDMAVDTFVGAALAAGLGAAGVLPAWIAIAALVVFGGGYLALRQPALSMAMQGVAYGALLWTLWSEGHPTFWVLVGVIATIAAIEARRLFTVVIPEFFRGTADAARLRRSDHPGMPRD